MAAICTTAMCSTGKARVTEMRRVFNILSGNPGFNRAMYEPSVLSIEQNFDDNYSLFSEWIPFNPACCAVDDIGKQAAAITLMMQSDAGVATTPQPSTGDVDLDSLVLLGGLALGAVILGNLSALRR